MKHWCTDKGERDRALPSCDAKYIYGCSTRYDNDFHLPSAKLKLFQKGFFIQELKHTFTFQRLSKKLDLCLTVHHQCR